MDPEEFPRAFCHEDKLQALVEKARSKVDNDPAGDRHYHPAVDHLADLVGDS